MTDYQNGKIYRLGSNQIEKYYIGSTCMELNERLWAHKSSYNTFIKGGKKTSAHEILKYPDAYIELIELFPCETNEQLLLQEGEYIKLNKDDIVNLVIAGSTFDEKAVKLSVQTRHKKWYDLHKADILERKKIYRDTNNVELNEKRRQDWADNGEANNEKQRLYREKNAEKTKAANKRSNDKRAAKKLADKLSKIEK